MGTIDFEPLKKEVRGLRSEFGFFGTGKDDFGGSWPGKLCNAS